MAALRACPFCRALYRPDEGRRCRECDVDLVALEKLPLSDEARAEAELEGEIVLPEHAPLPWDAFGRGRGALLALSLLGLCSFFMPWVELVRPETAVRSGFDLARGRAGWLWAGATGYFVLLPLVFTRRTIAAMRGARVIATLLASLTLAQVLMLLLLPPRPRGLVPLELHYTWGLYLSGVISLVATAVATRLGGALPPMAPAQTDDAAPASRTLH
ncbi:MAG TPA: hypothetical protein VKY73_11190 [Polyangiaceae bacterium]|nr:hypothetical protein [Polyangiaceae bacterium]